MDKITFRILLDEKITKYSPLIREKILRKVHEVQDISGEEVLPHAVVGLIISDILHEND